MKRPNNCRQEQMHRGEPYPRSGCEACESGGLFGCIFEMEIPAFVYYKDGNFYSMITRQGQGLKFYARWKLRAEDFPTEPEKFVHHEVLDYTKPDITRYIPNVAMIDKKYFHMKTQRIYTVDGFIWDSDLDRWKVSYWRDGCITKFVRLPDVFAVKFTEVK